MRIWKKKRRKEDVVMRLRTETPVPSFLSLTPRLQLGSFQYNEWFRLSDFLSSLCTSADVPKDGPVHLGLHDPAQQHLLHTYSVPGSGLRRLPWQQDEPAPALTRLLVNSELNFVLSLGFPTKYPQGLVHSGNLMKIHQTNQK